MKSWNSYVEEHVASLPSNMDKELSNLEKLLRATADKNGQIWVIGNGGSASTAEHFAADLNLTYRRGGPLITAFALTSMTAWVTALANDFSYLDVFKIQLESLLKPDDLIIAISASGNSTNVLRALELGIEKGIETFAILGFDGGEIFRAQLGKMLLFPTDIGKYGVVENLHLMLIHYLAERLKEEKYI